MDPLHFASEITLWSVLLGMSATILLDWRRPWMRPGRAFAFIAVAALLAIPAAAVGFTEGLCALSALACWGGANVWAYIGSR